MTIGRPPLAEALNLAPHPEGGWYRQTWSTSVRSHPAGYPGERATATAIYFLLNPGERSRRHRVRSDELWLWHRGGSLCLMLDGEDSQPAAPTLHTLGPDIEAGQTPQILVTGGSWQSAYPAGDEAVLVSCVVSPGFDFADFILLE